jgi:ATP-dependent DNA helicase DinG
VELDVSREDPLDDEATQPSVARASPAGAARELLGPGGPLASALDGYEDREGQLAMADAVERALEGRRVLLCEAGTGTGKTLAYLVPALLSGKKVVVSTATKALEEQIVHKDVPLIAEKIGLAPDVALVKGLANYLCKRRYEELRVSADSHADPAVRRALPMLEAWATDTESGDVAEIDGLREDDPLWREVSSSSETRVGASCEHYTACFVTRMKKDAERARVVVVNHHLFFADLAVREAAAARGFGGAGVLPPYDAVIFDEAHALEDVATSFFGVRLSKARIDAMLRDAERAFRAHGLSDLLGRGEGAAIAGLVREASGAFFDAVAAEALRARARDEARVPLGGEVWHGELDAARARLDSALEALSGYAETHAVAEPIRLVATRAADAQGGLARVSDPRTDHVTWAEVGRRNVAVGASPIDLSAMFRERVFDRVGAAVLTSATLATTALPAARATDDDARPSAFTFLRSRLGLDAATTVPVDELEVPSPFDYERNALLYTPRDLPEANDGAFLDRAAERAFELVTCAGGGAFVLCTSIRSMRGLAAGLGRRLGRPIFVQGDMPKAALLGRFRARTDAVLVATMSFWEGVDVPGDALRLVVIDKIPFAVPTDPVVAARSAALEAEGKNPFAHLSVPEAAITLKQGFGRLIRTRTDRGVVAILDRRIKTRSYGGKLLAALPPAPRTEQLADVDAFFRTRFPRPPG